MNFIELEKYDGGKILINKHHISSVVSYSSEYTTVRLNNGQTVEVKDTYDLLKTFLQREEKDGCCSK